MKNNEDQYLHGRPMTDKEREEPATGDMIGKLYRQNYRLLAHLEKILLTAWAAGTFGFVAGGITVFALMKGMF